MVRKSIKSILLFGAWTIITFAFLISFHIFGLDKFYSISLIGFIIIIELLGPFEKEPRFNLLVKCLAFTGIVAFFLIIAINILGALR